MSILTDIISDQFEVGLQNQIAKIGMDIMALESSCTVISKSRRQAISDLQRRRSELISQTRAGIKAEAEKETWEARDTRLIKSNQCGEQDKIRFALQCFEQALSALNRGEITARPAREGIWAAQEELRTLLEGAAA